MEMKESERDRRADHIFISYASEDSPLAEWLTLRLTAEGYKVWCDAIKLLGGESYPSDIDAALKTRVFRVLALLSRHSIRKPNPIKEWTTALNIAQERGEFLIPLNVDGLRKNELPWMLSDITYIPFTNWAAGFTKLLRKLTSVGAPKSKERTARTVCDWLAAQAQPDVREEMLYSNLFPILSIPDTIFFHEGLATRPPSSWPHEMHVKMTCFALELTPPPISIRVTSPVNWRDPPPWIRCNLSHVVTSLIRQYVENYCLTKGLIREPSKGFLYFPSNLIPGNRLSYTNYSGRRTWTQVAGQRKWRDGKKYSYHVVPVFRPRLGSPMDRLEMHTRVYIKDTTGAPLTPRSALARRKDVCGDWWNDKWLAKQIAVMQWLSGGDDELVFLHRDTGILAVGTTPVSHAIPIGIDEEKLGTPGFLPEAVYDDVALEQLEEET